MKSFAHTDADRWSPTRHSLVNRLRDLNDQDSWRDFFETYWKLIYTAAVRAGLSDQEAEDVVQETVITVSKKMDSFRYDPAVQSFKAWLLRVTRYRILDQFRKRGPKELQGSLPALSDTATEPSHRIPDPNGLALEPIWEEEWRKNLIDVAMERVKARVEPEHYQIFYLYALKNHGALEVSRMLGVSSGKVYVIKHRVAALVKKELAQLMRATGDNGPGAPQTGFRLL